MFREHTPTRAFRLKAASAKAFPIPDEAPVITITLFENDDMICKAAKDKNINRESKSIDYSMEQDLHIRLINSRNEEIRTQAQYFNFTG
jgi:hypothetical protein